MSLRVLRNYALYGGIAAGNAALGWPDGAALDWRFWLSVVVAALVALKALGSDGGRSEPQQVEVVNDPTDPVPTDQVQL